eukprot:gene3595-biopygen4891
MEEHLSAAIGALVGEEVVAAVVVEKEEVAVAATGVECIGMQLKPASAQVNHQALAHSKMSPAVAPGAPVVRCWADDAHAQTILKWADYEVYV